jgi:hypothetical protein
MTLSQYRPRTFYSQGILVLVDNVLLLASIRRRHQRISAFTCYQYIYMNGDSASAGQNGGMGRDDDDATALMGQDRR